jgi:hypothetical protein
MTRLIPNFDSRPQTSRQRLVVLLGASLWAMGGLSTRPALGAVPESPTLAQAAHLVQSEVIIYHHRGYPHHPRPVPEPHRVRVEFDAQGMDWGAVYLDGQLIYRPHNFNRQRTVYLRPGGYRLEVTGVVQSDLWASGYLDIGRDDSRLVVIRFSKAEGVQVAGPPYVWIPDQ